MTRSKDIGTRAETAVVRALQAAGWEATRVPLAGNQDRGDVHATDQAWRSYVIEVKAGHTAELASWAQCERWFAGEAEPAALRVDPDAIPLLVVKRKGHSEPENWAVFFSNGFLICMTTLGSFVDEALYGWARVSDAGDLVV